MPFNIFHNVAQVCTSQSNQGAFNIIHWGHQAKLLKAQVIRTTLRNSHLDGLEWNRKQYLLIFFHLGLGATGLAKLGFLFLKMFQSFPPPRLFLKFTGFYSVSNEIL